MTPSTPEGADGDEEKIVVELYHVSRESCPAAEVVAAIADSDRWRGRIDLRMQHLDGGPRVVWPYGSICEDTLVVGGTHVLRDADHAALVRALEEHEARRLS